MKKTLVLLSLFVCACGGQGARQQDGTEQRKQALSAESVPFVRYDITQNADNPATVDAYVTQAGNQNWVLQLHRGAATAVAVGSGSDRAWEVNSLAPGLDPGKEERWTIPVTEHDRSLGRAMGWTLSARIRLPSTGDAVGHGVAVEYAAGPRFFTLILGTDGAGNPQVRIQGDPRPAVTIPGGPTLFHTYELTYDPAFGTTDLRVDGNPTPVLANVTGDTLGTVGASVTFGDLASSDNGHGQYQWVQWRIHRDEHPPTTAPPSIPRGMPRVRYQITSNPGSHDPTQLDAHLIDPGVQPWVRQTMGVPSAIALVDGPVAALDVNSKLGFFGQEDKFVRTLSTDEAATANVRGWSLKARARLLRNDDTVGWGVAAQYFTGTRMWALLLGRDGMGRPVVGSWEDPRTVTIDQPGFHNYELVYNPATGTASIVVDNVVRLTDVPGQPYSDSSGPIPNVMFGDIAQADDGHGQFQLVEWTVADPDPQSTIVTTASGLTLDPATYTPPICIGAVGCTMGGLPRTMPTIPAGTHSITDNTSVELSTMSSVLGTLVVDSQGTATLTSSHFEQTGPSSIRLRVSPITVDHAGFLGQLSVQSVLTGAPPAWTVPLITGRRYMMVSQANASVDGTSNQFSSTFDVRIETDGSVNPGTETARHFIGVGRSLVARVVPVTIDHADYPGLLTVTSVLTGSGPSWTVPLMRERAYIMSDNASSDLAVLRNQFSSTYDVVLDSNDHLAVGAQTGRHFTHDPIARRLTARVISLTIDNMGYPAPISVSSVRTGSGSPWSVSLIRERAYSLGDNASANLAVTSNAICTYDVRLQNDRLVPVPGGDTLRHFTHDPDSRTLFARVVPVTIENDGYPAPLTMTSVRTGTASSLSVSLLRERAYGLSDNASADLTGTRNNFAPSSYDLKLENDVLNPGDDTERHFTQVGATTLRARTVEINVNHANYPAVLTIPSVKSGAAPSWNVRLIRERSYSLLDNSSADLGGTMNRFSTSSWDVKLRNDVLDPGADTLRHFTVDGTGRTLVARTLPVIIDHAGYPGALSVHSVQTGVGPTWTTHLIRMRSYGMLTNDSTNLAGTLNRFSASPWDVFLTATDALSVGEDTGLHFSHFPIERRLRANVANVTVTSVDVAGSFNVRSMVSGSGVGTSIGFSGIVGRRYFLDPGATPFQLPASGPCSPTTASITGGTVQIQCGGPAGPPAAPSNVQARLLNWLTTSGSVHITWNDNSGDETGFSIERSDNGAAFQPVGTVGPNSGGAGAGFINWVGQGTYVYRVRAVNTSGSSAGVDSPPVVVLPVPTPVLSATVVSGTRIDLSWTSVSRATTAILYRSVNGLPATELIRPDVTATSYSDTTMSGQTYSYRLEASNLLGSVSSNTVNVSTALPAPPTELWGTITTQGTAVVNWNYPSGVATGFDVQWRIGTSGSFSALQSVGALIRSVNHSGQPANRSLQFQVRAKNNAGTGVTWSTTLAFTMAVPPAPSGPSATILSSTQVQVRWTDNSQNENGFTVSRQTVGGSTTTFPITAPRATEFVDTPPTGGRYVYSVRATNAYGSSSTVSASEVNLNSPTAAANLAAIIQGPPTRVDLTWTNGSTNATSIRLERSAVGTPLLVVPLTLGATSYSDATALAGTTYEYRVISQNLVGSSSSSSVQVAMVPPIAPVNLAGRTMSRTQVNLTWDFTGSQHMRFRVERAVGTAGFGFLTNVDRALRAFNDTNAPSTSIIRYRVFAENGVGLSGSSNEVTANTTAPNPPTGVLAKVITGQRIDLTWTDVAQDELNYRVQQSTNRMSWSTLSAVLARDARSHTVMTGLQSGGTYYFRVFAVSGAGNGPPSADDGTRTAAVGATPAPSGLAVTSLGPNSVGLTWNWTATIQPNNENGFEVQRSLVSPVSWAAIGTAERHTRTFTDPAVQSGVAYQYRVQAFNGLSPRSNFSTPASLTTATSCSNSGDGAGCDDANPCTTADTCQNRVCVGGPPAPETTQCNSGIAGCGMGTCQAGACRLPAGGVCAVEPLLTCVVSRQGQMTAVFGYRNASSTNVYIPPSAAANAVTPGNFNQGQPSWYKAPTTEEPTQPVAFAVNFPTGTPISWQLGSRRVDASAATGSCTIDENGQDGPAVLLPPDGTRSSTIPHTISLDPARIASQGRGETQVEAGTLTAVDSTKASFDVTHDGAATAAVPIVVPPGRRGMEPKIALAYNSQRGNGLAGVGWELGGLGEIAVCPTNRRLDAEHRPIAFSGTDELCLDGQRLIRVTNLNAPPQPGAIFPPFGAVAEYRTERNENGRIASANLINGVPNTFDVARRDGRVYTYGAYFGYPDPMLGRVHRAGDPTPTVVRWPLTMIRDRFANRIEISYRRITHNQTYQYEEVPDQITYTGYPNVPGRRSVRFRYQNRANEDFQHRAVGGPLGTTSRFVELLSTQLLTGIDTFAPASTAPNAPVRAVRYYRLSHRSSIGTKRSLLESVTECEAGLNGQIEEGPTGTDDRCKRPVRFRWDEGASNFERLATGITDAVSGIDEDYTHVTTGDFNGDGQADLLYAIKRPEGGVPVRKHRLWLSNARYARNTDLYPFRSGQATFSFVTDVDTSKGYRNAAQNLNPWFHDMDGDGKSEILVPVSQNLSDTHSRFSYIVQGQTIANPGIATWGTDRLVGVPTAVIPGMGAAPLAVLTEFKYPRNLLVLPFDRFGTGRPGLAVLQETPVLHPAGAPDAPPREKWLCEFVYCNGRVEPVGCTDAVGETGTLTFSCPTADPDDDESRTVPVNCVQATRNCNNTQPGQIDTTPISRQCTGSCAGVCNVLPCSNLPSVRSVPLQWLYRDVNTAGQSVALDTLQTTSGEFIRTGAGTDDTDFDGDQELAPGDYRNARADFSGDGRREAAPVEARLSRVADMNGDGLPDVLELSQTGALTMRRWTRFGFVTEPTELPPVLPTNRRENQQIEFECSVADGSTVKVMATPNCTTYPDRTFCTNIEQGTDRYNCQPTGVVEAATVERFRFSATQVLDWNGDGLTDLITPEAAGGGHELVLYIRRGGKADTLRGIDEGFYVQTEVETVPLSDPTLDGELFRTTYVGGTSGCGYPVQCSKTGKWVVRAVTRHMDRPAGAGRVSRASSLTWRHFYTDGRRDLLGRGWLGFAEHEVVQSIFMPTPAHIVPPSTLSYQEKQLTRFEYAFVEDQGAFPLAGVATTVRRSTNRSNLTIHAGTESRMEHRVFRGVAATDIPPSPYPQYTLPGPTGAPQATVFDHSSNRRMYFVRPRRTTTTEYETNSQDVQFSAAEAKRQTVTAMAFDLYGNVDSDSQEVFVYRGFLQGLSATPLLTRTRDYDFEGDNGALGGALSTSRFLGLTTFTSTTERYGTEPERTRRTQNIFSADSGEKGVVDTMVVEPGAAAGSDERLSTTVTLNPWGLPVQMTAAGSGQSRVSTSTYDSAEVMYPEIIVNASNHQVRQYFSAATGAPVWTRDANGIVSRFVYDGFGRPIRTDGPQNGDESITYGTTDIGTPMLRLVSATGETSERELDEFGQEIVRRRQLPDQTWATVQTEYDQVGRLRRVVRPYGEAVFEFDHLGRLRAERKTDDDLGAGSRAFIEHDYFAGGVAFRAFTFEGTQVLGGSRNNRRESFTDEDGLGQTVESGEKLGSRYITSSYRYGPFRMLRRTFQGPLADAVQTEMDYDNHGRQTFLRTPDNGTTRTDYNAFGDIRHVVTADGRDLTLTPDPLGRLAQKTEVFQGGTSVTRFELDTAPNGIGMIGAGYSPDGVTTRFEYDPEFGAMRSTSVAIADVDGGAPMLTRVSFDGRGRPQSLTYPGTGPGTVPLTLANGYAAASGTLETVSDGATTLWRAQSREAYGRIRQESFDGGAISSSRTYGPLTGRLRSIQTSAGFQDIRYRYYPDGDLKVRSDGVTREGFTYDGLGRLDRWQEVNSDDWSGDDPDQGRADNGWRVAYQYDDRGNMQNRTVTRLGTGSPLETVAQTYQEGVTGPNRLSTSSILGGGVRLGYDGAGNVTNHPSLGTVTYNAFNLPKRTTGGPAPAGYLYDAFGSRVSKALFGGGGGAVSSRTVYVDGIYERRTQGMSTVHTMLVQVEGRTIAQITRGAPGIPDEVAYVFSDRYGSAEVLRLANGSRVLRRRDPFGNPLPDTTPRLADVRLATSGLPMGGPSDVTTGFTGHEEDREFGVVNMGGRIYDPRIGRFLQGDPIVSEPFSAQGHNRYAYVHNNPMRFTDPSGFSRNDTEGCGDQQGPDGTSIPVPCPHGSDAANSLSAEFEAEFGADWDCDHFDTCGTARDDEEAKAKADRQRNPDGAVLGPDGKPIHLAALNCWQCVRKEGESDADYKTRMQWLPLQMTLSMMPVGIAVSGIRAAATYSASAAMLAVQFVGRNGEKLVGLAKNTERILVGAATSAAYRVPDYLNHAARAMAEVKNVAALRMTNQMADFIRYASEKGYTFNLFVRASTTLDEPLEQARKSGLINVIDDMLGK